MEGWSFTEEADLLKCLCGASGIKGFFTFIDSDVPIAIATAE